MEKKRGRLKAATTATRRWLMFYPIDVLKDPMGYIRIYYYYLLCKYVVPRLRLIRAACCFIIDYYYYFFFPLLLSTRTVCSGLFTRVSAFTFAGKQYYSTATRGRSDYKYLSPSRQHASLPNRLSRQYYNNNNANIIIFFINFIIVLRDRRRSDYNNIMRACVLVRTRWRRRTRTETGYIVLHNEGWGKEGGRKKK